MTNLRHSAQAMAPRLRLRASSQLRIAFRSSLAPLPVAFTASSSIRELVGIPALALDNLELASEIQGGLSIQIYRSSSIELNDQHYDR